MTPEVVTTTSIDVHTVVSYSWSNGTHIRLWIMPDEDETPDNDEPLTAIIYDDE